MDQVQGMRVFVRVAQRGGFAAAARALRISPAAVTKQIAALEARVGARLFDRTTRRVALTEAGRIYLERSLECLQAFDDADASVSELSAAPRGTLRVSAPVDLHAQLPGVVASFMRAHRQVQVELRLSNRAVDLVEEGFDLAIRAAPSLDGRYVGRPLAASRLAVYAAPAYLREHGRPRRPADLERHRFIVFVEPRPMDSLVFTRGGTEVRIALTAAATGNIGDLLAGLAAEGVALFAAPSFVAQPQVAAGRLERVLADWAVLPELRLWALYPHRRFLSPKVRLFVDALRAAFGGDGAHDPWLDGAPRARATAGR